MSIQSGWIQNSNPMGSENVQKGVNCLEALYHHQMWDAPEPQTQ